MTLPLSKSKSKSYDAYYDAVLHGFTEGRQKTACENPAFAYRFAKDISGADIDYCQQSACKNPSFAVLFALYVPNADIDYCKKHMGEDLDQYLQIEMNQILK